MQSLFRNNYRSFFFVLFQALISSGQEESKQWNAAAAAQYLMKQLDSPSVDFLSVYLILPILSGRSLVDMQSVRLLKENKKRRKR